MFVKHASGNMQHYEKHNVFDGVKFGRRYWQRSRKRQATRNTQLFQTRRAFFLKSRKRGHLGSDRGGENCQNVHSRKDLPRRPNAPETDLETHKKVLDIPKGDFYKID